MRKTGIITLIIVVLVVAAGAFVLVRSRNNSNGSNQNATPAVSDTTSAPPAADTSSANTITYTNDGFSPATLTIKAGSQLTIKNSSSHILQFDSDPHPAHTDDPELNVGTIAPGESQTITVTTTGRHGYHNHANADDVGTLIVQ